MQRVGILNLFKFEDIAKILSLTSTKYIFKMCILSYNEDSYACKIKKRKLKINIDTKKMFRKK